MPAHRCWSYHAKNPPTVSSQLGIWACIFLHSWQNIYSTISQFSFSLTLWQQSTSKFQSNVNMNAKWNGKGRCIKKTSGTNWECAQLLSGQNINQKQIQKNTGWNALSVSTINTNNSVIIILFNFDLHLALPDSLVLSFEIKWELKSKVS